MSSPKPQRARRGRPRGDHRIIVRAEPARPIKVGLLAEALILLSTQQAATANNTPAPHLAGTHKLSAHRESTSEEGDDE